METTIINLAGSPGAGKSTGAAYIFAEMKMRGINCEYVQEFAKQMTWQERYQVLKNQTYVFGKQLHYLSNVVGKVEYIVTDSPLFLSAMYAHPEYPKSFNTLVLEIFNGFTNKNFYLRRTKQYNPVGRNQTSDESDKIGVKIYEYMVTHEIPFISVDGCREGYNQILRSII